MVIKIGKMVRLLVLFNYGGDAESHDVPLHPQKRARYVLFKKGSGGGCKKEGKVTSAILLSSQGKERPTTFE